MRPVVEVQLAQYPEMSAGDWYKLVFQAAMGLEHLGADSAAVYNYLIAEWNSIEAGHGEPLVEAIAPDTSMLRLNLRPYKAIGGQADQLFGAMQHTVANTEPDAERLEAWWGMLQEEALSNRLLPSVAELKALGADRKEKGWPAEHHSEVYGTVYQPAYRVLRRVSLIQLRISPHTLEYEGQ